VIGCEEHTDFQDDCPNCWQWITTRSELSAKKRKEAAQSYLDNWAMEVFRNAFTVEYIDEADFYGIRRVSYNS